MPWNGTGTYALPPAYSPEVNGTVIDAVRYNGLTSDVATGISIALAKDGQNIPTANLPMGGFKHTGASPAGAAAVGEYLVYGQTLGVGLVNFSLGAVNTPSITFVGDLNTGMWSPGADTIAWSTLGVEGFRLLSTGGLIMGGTVPGSVSSATTKIFTVNASAVPVVEWTVAGVTAGSILATTSELRINAVSPGLLTFFTANVNRLQINTTGLAQFTTTSAISADFNSTGVNGGYAQWSVAGSAYAQIGNSNVLVTGGSINDLAIRASTAMNFSINGTPSMRLDNGSRFGIGTALGALSDRLTAYTAGGANSIRSECGITSDASFRSKTTLGDFLMGTGIGIASNVWRVYDLGAGAMRLNIDSVGTITDQNSNELGYKGLPLNQQAVAYTLTQADNGKKVLQSGAANVTAFAGATADFACVVVNASGGIITLVNTGVTMRLAGTATVGSRTLASWATASISHIGSNIWLVSGAGVT